MKYFKIWPEYDKDGEHFAKWVDDARFLTDFSIFRDRPLQSEWPKGISFPASKEGVLCDVLFNPDGLFFSQNVRDALEPVVADSVEWLPVLIGDVGTYYLLHPLKTADLSPDARVKKNAVSKNFTLVEKYDFVTSQTLPACFMIRQAEDSDARKADFCMRDIVVSEQFREHLAKFRGIDFAIVYESRAGSLCFFNFIAPHHRINNCNVMKEATKRSIFRWIHIVFSIPIAGYIYSPFERIPEYAVPTRFVFFPVLVLTGLWMWKGHLVRRLFSKSPA